MSVNEFTSDDVSIIETWVNLDNKKTTNSVVFLKRDNAHMAKPKSAKTIAKLKQALARGANPENVITDKLESVQFSRVKRVESAWDKTDVHFICRGGARRTFYFANTQQRDNFYEELKRTLGKEFTPSFRRATFKEAAGIPFFFAVLFGSLTGAFYYCATTEEGNSMLVQRGNRIATAITENVAMELVVAVGGGISALFLFAVIGLLAGRKKMKYFHRFMR